MSRRLPGSDSISPSGAERALEELCVELGYCLAPDAQEAILSSPPPDADAFVDAVLVAEGRDPSLITKQERRPMIEIVAKLIYNH